MVEMLTQTTIDPDGSVSVTIDTDGDEAGIPAPMAVEDMLRESGQAALTAWASIHTVEVVEDERAQ